MQCGLNIELDTGFPFGDRADRTRVVGVALSQLCVKTRRTVDPPSQPGGKDHDGHNNRTPADRLYLVSCAAIDGLDSPALRG